MQASLVEKLQWTPATYTMSEDETTIYLLWEMN